LVAVVGGSGSASVTHEGASETSRRKFLAVAGAGTAGAAVVGLTGGSAVASGTSRSRDAAREPVVAYVQNPHADVVHLMVGEREVIVEDRELVARILNAAGHRSGRREGGR
jgi:ABC-type hemin transport system substrate-binding protein